MTRRRVAVTGLGLVSPFADGGVRHFSTTCWQRRLRRSLSGQTEDKPRP